ncbi:hypothetical protein CC1G_07537 [Coprinopsis cinerea okayama7|uniref:Uncharacterized protein n=1 Tax=Coprinopsis cinerea (strain Okayama-7 / 130 / ATCC MYA-4618 / FGSC 9003) TaxID=240176 RepID=A8P186_COPC7|nr:hypothetical protein CC1G_07537 [Coprinopsis cinerea okayama7\|eukprot:XP_001838047.2 hypothetical protein CC1G_07537 [Coprinopsis cinerea okayama7\
MSSSEHLQTHRVPPRSVKDLLDEHKTAVLVDSVDGRNASEYPAVYQTLLYHHDVLSGTLLSLEKIARSFDCEAGDASYHTWVACKKVVDQCNRQALRHPLGEVPPIVKEQSLERLTVEIGLAQRHTVAGPHITYLNPRIHDDVDAMIAEAQRRYKLLRLGGLSGDEVLLTIPSSEAGIQAARTLQKANINVNLYPVCTLMHAAACVEAGAAAITVNVGQVLGWFERGKGARAYPDAFAHPGVKSIQSILTYFRINDIKTRLIGQNFRKMAEIALLADFDAVAVSEYQLDRLQWNIARIAPPEEVPKEVLEKARQAKYPAGLLTDDGNFLKKLDHDSQNLIRSTLDPELERSSKAMDKIEDAVFREVKNHWARLNELNPNTRPHGVRSDEEGDRRVSGVAKHKSAAAQNAWILDWRDKVDAELQLHDLEAF